jgi:hypothetical protein
MEPDQLLLYDWLCERMDEGKLGVIVLTEAGPAWADYTVADWSPLLTGPQHIRGQLTVQAAMFTLQSCQ